MKIAFSWESKEGILSPCCESDIMNNDGISLLSCLLMDDGGIPYLETIPWIHEGAELIGSDRANSPQAIESKKQINSKYRI